MTSPDPSLTNIQAIARLEQQMLHSRSGADRIGAAITRIAGSLVFVGVHAVWFAAWIAVNAELVPGVPVFDPYPFSFLTLVVSLEAIFLAIFVLMSQNRAARGSLDDVIAHDGSRLLTGAGLQVASSMAPQPI